MKNSIIALVDCDSFFASCEQALNPALEGNPVCVMSHVGGIILARSQEAKKLGIAMGMPQFKAIKQFPQAHYIIANHSAYIDFSRQVMSILKNFSPDVEVYSIDEAFVELGGLQKLYKKNSLGIAKLIREKIKAEVGINVSIGISKSKVLAKLACENAKPGRGSGIYLIGEKKIPKVLRQTKVQEIWGIGRKTALLFNRWGILTCDELVKMSDEILKARIGKRGVELKHELLGESIDRVKSDKKLPKSIQNTRSFQKCTSDLDYIKNALNIHIHNSCTRLRKYKGKCLQISVMLKSKDFIAYWDKSVLNKPTNFELEISREAIKIIEKLYNPGFFYRSCGVSLENIDYSVENQLSLFIEEKTKDYDKLAQSIDKLEQRFGKNIVKTGFIETKI